MNKFSHYVNLVLLFFCILSCTNLNGQNTKQIISKSNRITGLQNVTLKNKEQILTRIANSQAQFSAQSISSGPVNVSVVSLNGITGYPSLDSMQLCGGPDTLAVLIFTNAPTPITNIAMDLNYSGGIEFGGFLTTVPTGQIVPINLSNSLSPKFNIPTLDQNNAIIAYVAVKTNCSSLNNDNMNLEFEFNYTYNDGTGSKKYKDLKSFGSNEFAPAVLRPVLNFRNDPADLTFTNLNTNYCQSLTVSQDGIRAVLDSFEFTIDSLNTSLLNFVSLKINNITYPFKIDTANNRLTAIIKGTVFQSNTNNNGPANNYFNENESLTIQTCYSITGCISQPLIPIAYSIKQICAGNSCYGSDDYHSEIFKFSPSFGANPVAVVTMLSNAEVCGAPAVLKVEFNSSVTDPLKGLYEDIDLRLNSCDSNFLHLNSIKIGVAPNQFTLPQNLIGYTTAGQILVNIKDGLTVDPDGPGGLADTDGDGFFDDLPGGQKLTLEVYLDVQCAEGLQGCAAVSCKIESVNVTGYRNCRTYFSANAGTPNAPLIGFVSGGRYSNTNQLPNLTQGYNFGVIGYVNGIDDTPSSQDMEFNYAFNPTNFVTCGGQHILQFAISGPPEIVFDMPFSNVMSGMQGGPFSPAVFTVIDSPNISTRFLRIEVAAPTALDTFTCKWTSTLDTSYCTPGLYFSGSATLIEECPTCACEIKKACRSITMYVDPNDIGCDCDMSSIVEIKRKTTGYTNTDLTTKLTPDQSKS
ncbi:MAG: hypothetical protein IPL95_12805 [Saprospiraceae bacterium]|nr:hypothetical protein [Saprospiraceae bacterium]